MAWTTPRTFVTGELETASIFNTHLRDNLKALGPLDHAEITSPVTVTATAVGGATLIVSGASLTYEAIPTMVEFFAPIVTPASAVGGVVEFFLFDGGTVIGAIGQVKTPAASSMQAPVCLKYRITPSAGSHQYIVRAIQSGGNGTVTAGAGGSTNFVPAYLRITGAP